jgi:hypothetical protein
VGGPEPPLGGRRALASPERLVRACALEQGGRGAGIALRKPGTAAGDQVVVADVDAGQEWIGLEVAIGALRGSGDIAALERDPHSCHRPEQLRERRGAALSVVDAQRRLLRFGQPPLADVVHRRPGADHANGRDVALGASGRQSGIHCRLGLFEQVADDDRDQPGPVQHRSTQERRDRADAAVQKRKRLLARVAAHGVAERYDTVEQRPWDGVGRYLAVEVADRFAGLAPVRHKGDHRGGELDSGDPQLVLVRARGAVDRLPHLSERLAPAAGERQRLPRDHPCPQRKIRVVGRPRGCVEAAERLPLPERQLGQPERHQQRGDGIARRRLDQRPSQMADGYIRSATVHGPRGDALEDAHAGRIASARNLGQVRGRTLDVATADRLLGGAIVQFAPAGGAQSIEQRRAHERVVEGRLGPAMDDADGLEGIGCRGGIVGIEARESHRVRHRAAVPDDGQRAGQVAGVGRQAA